MEINGTGAYGPGDEVIERAARAAEDAYMASADRAAREAWTDSWEWREVARAVLAAAQPAPVSPAVTGGEVKCWLCLGLGGVALHHLWTARRGAPLFTAHAPTSESHEVWPCPACAQPAPQATETAAVLRGLVEEMRALFQHPHSYARCIALVEAALRRVEGNG
jgi:hypothetical protein